MSTIDTSPEAVAALVAKHRDLYTFFRHTGDAENMEMHGTAVAALEALVKERDAYRKAKQENDERFMLERDEARAERDDLRARLEAALHDIGESNKQRDAARSDLNLYVTSAIRNMGGRTFPKQHLIDELAKTISYHYSRSQLIDDVRQQLTAAQARVQELEALLKDIRDPRPSQKWQADKIDSALAHSQEQDGGAK